METGYKDTNTGKKGTVEAISNNHQQVTEHPEERDVPLTGDKPQIMSVIVHNHEASMPTLRLCKGCCHTRLHTQKDL